METYTVIYEYYCCSYVLMILKGEEIRSLPRFLNNSLVCRLSCLRLRWRVLELIEERVYQFSSGPKKIRARFFYSSTFICNE